MDVMDTDDSDFMKEVDERVVTEINSRILKMTDDEYFKDSVHITNSDMSELKKSPKHFKLCLDQKKGLEIKDEDKKHNIEGKALHCAILEPNEFEKRFFVIDDTVICGQIGGAKPRGTNKYKEWKEEFMAQQAGRQELDFDFFIDTQNMRDTVHSIAEYRGIIDYVQKEIIVYDEVGIDPDPVVKIKRKAKYDGLNPGQLILDIKTTRNPISDFAKNIFWHDIDRQMAWYSDIARTPKVIILAIEKERPYSTGLFLLKEETLQVGREKYMQLLTAYKKQILQGGIKDFNKFYTKQWV
jgi:hypothetical protein